MASTVPSPPSAIGMDKMFAEGKMRAIPLEIALQACTDDKDPLNESGQSMIFLNSFFIPISYSKSDIKRVFFTPKNCMLCPFNKSYVFTMEGGMYLTAELVPENWTGNLRI